MVLDNLGVFNIGFRADSSLDQLEAIKSGEPYNYTLVEDARDLISNVNKALETVLNNKGTASLVGMSDKYGIELSEYFLLFSDELEAERVKSGSEEEKKKAEFRFKEKIFHLKEAENCLENLLAGNEVLPRTLEKTTSIFKYLSNKLANSYKRTPGCW